MALSEMISPRLRKLSCPKPPRMPRYTPPRENQIFKASLRSWQPEKEFKPQPSPVNWAFDTYYLGWSEIRVIFSELNTVRAILDQEIPEQVLNLLTSFTVGRVIVKKERPSTLSVKKFQRLRKLWICENCPTQNLLSSRSCSNCNYTRLRKTPTRRGDWTCGNCDETNSISAAKCSECHRSPYSSDDNVGQMIKSPPLRRVRSLSDSAAVTRTTVPPRSPLKLRSRLPLRPLQPHSFALVPLPSEVVVSSSDVVVNPESSVAFSTPENLTLRFLTCADVGRREPSSCRKDDGGRIVVADSSELDVSDISGQSDSKSSETPNEIIPHRETSMQNEQNASDSQQHIDDKSIENPVADDETIFSEPKDSEISEESERRWTCDCCFTQNNQSVLVCSKCNERRMVESPRVSRRYRESVDGIQAAGATWMGSSTIEANFSKALGTLEEFPPAFAEPIPEVDTKNTELEACLAEERVKTGELQEVLEENALKMKRKEDLIKVQSEELRNQATELELERQRINDSNNRFVELEKENQKTSEVMSAYESKLDSERTVSVGLRNSVSQTVRERAESEQLLRTDVENLEFSLKNAQNEAKSLTSIRNEQREEMSQHQTRLTEKISELKAAELENAQLEEHNSALTMILEELKVKRQNDQAIATREFDKHTQELKLSLDQAEEERNGLREQIREFEENDATVSQRIQPEIDRLAELREIMAKDTAADEPPLQTTHWVFFIFLLLFLILMVFFISKTNTFQTLPWRIYTV